MQCAKGKQAPAEEPMLRQPEEPCVRQAVGPHGVNIEAQQDNDGDISTGYARIPQDAAGGRRRTDQQRSSKQSGGADAAHGATDDHGSRYHAARCCPLRRNHTRSPAPAAARGGCRVGQRIRIIAGLRIRRCGSQPDSEGVAALELHHPIHFPAVAVVSREGLFPTRAARGDL